MPRTPDTIAAGDTDLIGFTSVQRVVNAEELGTVQRLFIQDVLNGALDTGNYDVVFHARHYGGPRTGGTGNPFKQLIST